MTGASTTREDVERELHLLDTRRRAAGFKSTAWDMWAERTEGLIRALLDERDAARAVIGDSPAGYYARVCPALLADRDAARARIEELSAEVERMREALVKAVAPLEAMTIAETVRVHSEDVREAIVDGLVAARAALAGAPCHE